MATHLAASMDHWVGIAAVTPSHLSSSGSIVVPHETSSLVASTLTQARVTSGNPASPIASHVESYTDTGDSGKKRPHNAAEWQAFCRAFPENMSCPGKIRAYKDEYDRTHE